MDFLDLSVADLCERSVKLIEYEGETYLTATEVARRFKVSRGACYNNLLRHVKTCYLPGRKNALYQLSEVEQFSQVRVIVACPAERTIAAKQEVRPALAL